ncbi:MAG: VOC family protein [Methylobacterium mesophilicum]|nr:VOC family protein [Methylobacterium mesophilicum]
MTPDGILEAALYASDLEAAAWFYGEVLGLEEIARVEGRHVFFRCGQTVVLVFNPNATVVPPLPDAKLPVPSHGARGPGHLCFRASSGEIEAWRARLEEQGVAVEAAFEWPQGGRSIYFRDPAGNSLEFAEPRIWSMA